MKVKVLLVEKGNCLGGAATNCLVNPFMPNATKINDEIFQLSQGLFNEICDELTKMNKLMNVVDPHGSKLTFNEEYLKIILNRMALASGVELLFHTYLTGVVKEGDKITGVRLANKSSTMEMTAKNLIDATGDMNLGVLAGCAFKLGREGDQLCQPMTLCFRVANVDKEKFQKARPNINPLYKEFQKQGKIKNIREDVLIFDTFVDGVLHFNSTRVVKLNPTNAFELTKAEIEAREQVIELFLFLRDNIDGFQNSKLLSTAAEIGVRESRMLLGEYVLTGDDLVSCEKFEDSIALGNYDIDIHNPEGSGTSHYYFPEGKYYTIPYRSLVPREVSNLLVAGRCISATHEAQASIRILPIVCTLGEAAGVAAAIANIDCVSVKNVEIAKLQEQLRSNKAVF